MGGHGGLQGWKPPWAVSPQIEEPRGARQTALPPHPTCPAVPATTILAVYLQRAIFCTPRRGSSL